MAQNKINYKLNIIQWNCQSLLPKIHDLGSYLINDNIHICILSETWLAPDRQLNVTGYSVFRKDRNDGYGGLAILIHNTIDCRLKTLTTNYNNIDILCVELLSSCKLKYIIGVYSSSSVSVSGKDYEELFSHFSQKTLIAGDFNAHHSAWSYTTDTRGRLLSDASLGCNYSFLNNGDFTRCAKLNNSIVCTSPDVSFCSSDIALDFHWSVTNESFGSDHLVISINTLDSTQINPEKKRNIKKADWAQYTLHIKTACEFEGIDNSDDLQSSYNRLIDIIDTAANTSIPYIKHSPQPNKFKPKPWWNSELSKAVAERRLALKLFRRSRNVVNYTIYREKVLIARKLIKQAKRNSWQSFYNSIDSNMSTREVWRKLRWLKGYRSPKDYLPENTAISFLTELSPDSVNLKPYQAQTDSPSTNSFFTLSELTSILKRKDTSAGIDNITYSMINNLPRNAKQFMLDIFNLIYKTGETPEQWRFIKLIAIPKRNTDILKHRPISLMNCLCKVFNLMITRRLEFHFESKKLFNECTLGFRRGFSCQDNLGRFVTDTETAFVNKEYVLCAYGDISNAYNNVAIDPLITALREFEVDPFLCRYIREFLRERFLIYRLRDGKEITRIGRQGLAQGDPMSPILFNIVTIKLCNALVDSVKVSQYADDFALYYIHKNIATCVNIIQSSLNIFKSILEQIGLEISLSKTKLCILTRKYRLPAIVVKINGIQIEVLKCIKFLGVWVDSRLNWTRQITEISQKCIGYVNILSSLSSAKWGVHPVQLRRLYIALVRSRLDYGSILYGNASPNLLKKLDIVQNQCLRLCGSFIRTTPIYAMESELCIPPLAQRRTFLSAKYILKLSSRKSDYLMQQLGSLDNKLKPGVKYWRKSQIPLLLDSFRMYSKLQVSKFEILPQYQIPFEIFSLSWNEIISTKIKNLNESKDKLSSLDLKKLSEEMINQFYTDYYHLYTDGSKSLYGSGCAFYDDYSDFGAKFLVDNPYIPIMGLELTALCEAVHYIESTSYQKVVIFTDSKSSLQHLLGCTTGGSGRNEAYLVIKCINNLIRSGVEVRLQWIPSHVGIRGNDRADSLASEALQSGIPLTCLPHFTDYTPVIKRDMYNKFKNYFNENAQTKGIWYKSVVNEPPRFPWFSSLNFNRRELVICFRARTFHIPLNKFNFLMRKRDDPNCTKCGKEEDLLHLVLECKINEQIRLQFLNDTQCLMDNFLFFFHQILSSNFTIDHSDRLLSFLIHSLTLRFEYYNVS